MVIELTEHERIEDYDAIVRDLPRLGSDVRLAVDDAGSGYSSLKHILSLQPSYVKLDMEWVRGIHDDPVRRALVSGLAYFAQETGPSSSRKASNWRTSGARWWIWASGLDRASCSATTRRGCRWRGAEAVARPASDVYMDQ